MIVMSLYPRETLVKNIRTSIEAKQAMLADKALQACRARGIPSVLFTGGDGGRSAQFADHVVIAKGRATATIQELHIVLAHTLCECVEQAIFSN